MIVGREQLIELENLAKQQVQIFDDACDIGIETTEELRETIRRICRELQAEGFAGAVDRYAYGVSMLFFIPIEYEGDKVAGTEIKISRHKSPTKKKDFFTIEFERRLKPRDYKSAEKR